MCDNDDDAAMLVVISVAKCLKEVVILVRWMKAIERGSLGMSRLLRPKICLWKELKSTVNWGGGGKGRFVNSWTRKAFEETQ